MGLESAPPGLSAERQQLRAASAGLTKRLQHRSAEHRRLNRIGSLIEQCRAILREKRTTAKA